MTNEEQKLREFAEHWMPMVRYKDKERFIECLIALISEGYYPKEFVRWFDAKQGWGRVTIDNAMLYVNLREGSNIKYTLDELFNYWKENEQ